MQTARFNLDTPLFTSSEKNEVVIIAFKQKPLFRLVDLEEKQVLFDLLDRIGRSDAIRSLVIEEAPTKMSRTEYIAFYRSMLGDANERIHLERMNNAIGQLVLKLVNLDQLVVHADSGDVILLFMNLGLACDYRIVADNTVFQNPNIELDVIPRGGGVFFLSKMRGEAVASKVLLSGKNVEASQACHLGIVDEVVPEKRLHQAALKTALRFAAMPRGYVTGIKKLLQFNCRELPEFLEFENEYLRKRYATTRQAG